MNFEKSSSMHAVTGFAFKLCYIRFHFSDSDDLLHVYHFVPNRQEKRFKVRDKESTMTDAVIIGAGPAGATAAQVLAERGYHITVFEKGPLKREKPCGGGIPEVALKEFSITLEKGRSVYGVFLCSPQNRTAALTQEERAGISVMRSEFDYYLIERAQKAGAEFKENAPAEPQLENGKLKGVKTREECFESQMVIACDGAFSNFARKMGVHAGSRKRQAVAFQYQMALSNQLIEERIGNVLELYFGNQWVPMGYTWIFPKDGIVTVGNASWRAALERKKVSLKSMLNTFIEKHPLASKKLEGAHILYSQSHILSFPGTVKSVYGDHFLIAGDAGGFTSCATGGGVYYALVSGKTAGEVAAEALEKNDFSRKFLKKYKKRVDKKIGADMKWGSLLRTLMLNKDADQEKFIQAVRKDNWLRELSILLLKEEIRYDQFLIKLMSHPHRILRFIL